MADDNDGRVLATLAGFQDALDQDYRYLLNMDADFSYRPQSSRPPSIACATRFSHCATDFLVR